MKRMIRIYLSGSTKDIVVKQIKENIKDMEFSNHVIYEDPAEYVEVPNIIDHNVNMMSRSDILISISPAITPGSSIELYIMRNIHKPVYLFTEVENIPKYVELLCTKIYKLSHIYSVMSSIVRDWYIERIG